MLSVDSIFPIITSTASGANAASVEPSSTHPPPPPHQPPGYPLCYPHQLPGYPHPPPPPRPFDDGFPAHIPSTSLAESDAINPVLENIAPYKKNLVFRDTLAEALDQLGNNPAAILSDERYKDTFYGVSEEILKTKIQKFESYYDYICKEPSWKRRPGGQLEGPIATRPKLIGEGSSSKAAQAQGALLEKIRQMFITAFERILPILSQAQAQGVQREQIQRAFDTALERFLTQAQAQAPSHTGAPVLSPNVEPYPVYEEDDVED